MKKLFVKKLKFSEADILSTSEKKMVKGGAKEVCYDCGWDIICIDITFDHYDPCLN